MVEFQQSLKGSAGEGQPRQEKVLSKGLHGAFQVVPVVKNPPTNAGDIRDVGLISGAPGGGHGNPLQYSCLENPVDRGAWGGYSPCGRKELDATKQLTIPLL